MKKILFLAKSDIYNSLTFFQGEEGSERSLSSRSLSPAKTPGPFSPMLKSPSLEDMSDKKDIKIKELEDTIKLLMGKLAACDDSGEVNGHNKEETGVEEEIIEES